MTGTYVFEFAVKDTKTDSFTAISGATGAILF
ncbi:hypothetical protein amad1_10455 [Alteromonas mediterranea DE1]|uniref:Uncharacterized protein n=2 Tax=Alteromonas mediterranea TaxID=314275 RepID=S5AFE8_9ALTE|nr:hypothetical protein MADE_1009655 [Alteromonas mediterranea DE]AFV85598.1 hypothetical protein amad1_10455 [Alteromonas mediterranea DE1]AGP78069.1 hypothetical protein I633_10500 [Alteromonas mediterranea 615]AGP81894.1 hypothetical protein I533_09620 [Alteromonas mediterranea MED64]AGP85656.1 hypothetical protein I607_09305 [Alteromonas mediterranea U4]AGP89794.1 hypothetical protein I876_09665 [Alteromonas mediterranea U7]AGP93662.1 hypothetical protein I634_09745 [Alteromonas mediterra